MSKQRKVGVIINPTAGKGRWVEFMPYLQDEHIPHHVTPNAKMVPDILLLQYPAACRGSLKEGLETLGVQG